MADDGFNEYMSNKFNDNNSNPNNLAQYDINKHIEQGVQFKNYGKKYYSENEHNLLQETSSNTLGSITEALTGGDSTQWPGSGASNNPENESIANFNELVSTYSTLYNSYVSIIMTRPPTDAPRLAMEKALRDQNIAIQDAAKNIHYNPNLVSGNNAAVNQINTALHELKKKQNDVLAQENKYNMDTVNGQIETTNLNMTSMYYHYFVYFAISIVLISFTFNILVNPNANVMNAIYVVVGLLAVYFFVRNADI
jgi:hypothetical protein